MVGNHLFNIVHCPLLIYVASVAEVWKYGGEETLRPIVLDFEVHRLESRRVPLGAVGCREYCSVGQKSGYVIAVKRC